MKTTEQHAPIIRESEKNGLVIRLERIQNDLIQLRCQLDSYRCEPKTYVLFEYIESLKNGMEKLSKSNIEIINRLRDRRKTISDHLENVTQQFLEFDKLKDSVADYRTKCLHH